MPTRAERARTSLPAIGSFGCGAFLQLRCVLPSGGVAYQSVSLSRAQAACEAICKRSFSCQLSMHCGQTGFPYKSHVHCGQTRFLLQTGQPAWADKVSPTPTSFTSTVGWRGNKLRIHCGQTRFPPQASHTLWTDRNSLKSLTYTLDRLCGQTRLLLQTGQPLWPDEVSPKLDSPCKTVFLLQTSATEATRGFSYKLDSHCGHTRFLLQAGQPLLPDEVSPTNWTATVLGRGFSDKLHTSCGHTRLFVFSYKLDNPCGQTRLLIQSSHPPWPHEVSPTNWTAVVSRKSSPYKLNIRCGQTRFLLQTGQPLLATRGFSYELDGHCGQTRFPYKLQPLRPHEVSPTDFASAVVTQGLLQTGQPLWVDEASTTGLTPTAERRCPLQHEHPTVGRRSSLTKLAPTMGRRGFSYNQDSCYMQAMLVLQTSRPL